MHASRTELESVRAFERDNKVTDKAFIVALDLERHPVWHACRQWNLLRDENLDDCARNSKNPRVPSGLATCHHTQDPYGRVTSSSLNTFLNIFPTFVFGSSCLKYTCFGTLYPARDLRQ